MFLVSMNALILGGMGLGSLEMAILNTCAFAPVPVMLYLFRKLSDKKGLRFAFQTCLLSFAVSISLFATVCAAKIIGACLPLLAKKCHLDPTVVASPFITTIVDVLSLIIFCNLSILILA
jgi:magnesium transporter